MSHNESYICYMMSSIDYSPINGRYGVIQNHFITYKAIQNTF